METQMQACKGPTFLPIKLFLISAFFFGYSSCLKLGETCTDRGNQCDAGLTCGTCPANGNTRPRCTRIQPIIPTTKIKGLPFNKYSWLTTHNSFARSELKTDPGASLLAPVNQEDSVADQLKNGVRGLMLDMYDLNDDIYLCHSFGGTCYNATAFQPAVEVLREVQSFLKQNPTEIVTIFIEDYVKLPRALVNVFNTSGLTPYMFPMSRMPRNGEDWPLVDDMIEKNQRLVVFSSKSSKQETDDIAYEWNYVVESQYGNEGMKPGFCPQRAESAPMSTTSRSMVLMNYFPTNPEAAGACEDNSVELINMMKTCYEADGKRWPNFIAVDYYKRSDGGGAAQTVDEANGRMTCGCDNIAYCRENSTFGTCDVPMLAPPPPAQLSSVAPDSANDSIIIRRPLQLQWVILAILSMLLIWL